jgi:hypothetical protein
MKSGQRASQVISSLSNLALGTTTIPELAWAIQRVYWDSWDDYWAHHLSIDYDLSNAGTGAAHGATIQASLCAPDTAYAVTSLPLLATRMFFPSCFCCAALKANCVYPCNP